MEFRREDYEFLRGNEKGSFAEKTLSDRVPGIGLRTLEANRASLEPESAEQIQSLIQSMPHGVLREVERNSAAHDAFENEETDLKEWNEHLKPYLGQSWLQVPWYVAETYFYRRLIEATRPIGQADLFQHEKSQALQDASGAILRLAQIPNARLQLPLSKNSLQELELVRWTFDDLAFRSLWANRADLSLWKPGDAMLSAATSSTTAQESLHEIEEREKKELDSRVLVDDTSLAWNHLLEALTTSETGLDIGFINDNCGIELIADMRLADFLLESGIASKVTFHLKQHGFFVSDAMPKDALQSLEFIASLEPKESNKEVGDFARRLRSRLEDKTWTLENDRFWTSARLFNEMPSRVRERLAQHHLVISKGDANYRRLAGERRYHHHLPFATVAVGPKGVYFPAPVLALRTCKADIAVGIPENKVKEVAAQDPEWLVNGRWGLIQFASPSSSLL